MKKTLYLIIAIFLLSLVFVMQSCNNDTGDISGDTTDAETTDSETTADVQAQKDAIKAEVLALMAEDSREDPTYILKNFIGDYTVLNATIILNGTEFSDIKRIYSKDGIYAMEHDDNGKVGYAVTTNGYKVNVMQEGTKKLEVTNIQTVSSSLQPSIFSDIGLDISTIYTADSDESEVEEPELTAEMLDVSDDLATCTFSEEYLADVAKSLIQAMSLTEADTQKFMQSFVGKGEYDVEVKRVSFSLSGETESYGKISISLSHKENDEEGLYHSVRIKVERKNEDGTSLTVTNELTASDVKYNGDKVVSAKLLSSLGQVIATQSESNSIITSTDIDVSFGDASKGDGFNVEQTVLENSWAVSKVTMRLVDGKISANMKINLIERMVLEGENVTFQAPNDVDIPVDSIMKVVNDAINKYESGK